MAGNPSPQHNPTDGLGVAAYVTVSGTNIGNCSQPVGGAGQGTGAIPSAGHPVAQYALTLSLSSKTISGVAYSNSCAVTAVLKDANDTTYTPAVTNNVVWKSYADPSFSGYNPNPFVPPSSSPAYNGVIASATSTGQLTGTITGLAVGSTVVEVCFSTFDYVAPSTLSAQFGNPWQMIYARINVTVVP
jgi:hypothetical protein